MRSAVFLVMILLAGHLAAQTCEMRMATLLNKEKFSEVIKAGDSCPSIATTTRLVGMAYYCLFNADSALHYFTLAEKSGLRDDSLLVGLAGVWLWKKNPRKAAHFLERAQDKSTIAWLGAQALVEEAQGRFEEAQEIYDRILAQRKDAYEVMVKRGNVLAWQKKFDPSITQFSQVIADPKAPRRLQMEARLRRAETIAWTKKIDDAQKSLDTLLTLDPKNSAAFVMRGTFCEWQGDFKKAKAAYQEALNADPANKIARLRIEKLLWVK